MTVSLAARMPVVALLAMVVVGCSPKENSCGILVLGEGTSACSLSTDIVTKQGVWNKEDSIIDDTAILYSNECGTLVVYNTRTSVIHSITFFVDKDPTYGRFRGDIVGHGVHRDSSPWDVLDVLGQPESISVGQRGGGFVRFFYDNIDTSICFREDAISRIVVHGTSSDGNEGLRKDWGYVTKYREYNVDSSGVY